MANVLRPEKQRAVLHLLTEGSSMRAAERLTGVHRDTICRLVVRFGNACARFLDDKVRGLDLRHVQLDEIWTFVGKKQARLTVDEKAERHDIGDVYLWTAFDQDTKLVPTFVIGKRSADNARRIMRDLASRLNFPLPHASDRHNYRQPDYKPVCQLSTDGFAGYPEAVDLAFGPYAKYGVIVKDYRNARMPYTPSELIGSQRTARRGMAEREEWTICTSHVERHNLTIRTFMRRFTRLSLGFSKKLENLSAAVAMYMAFYNFCWRPRFPGTSGRRRVTPAVAAGITSELWSFDRLFSTVAG